MGSDVNHAIAEYIDAVRAYRDSAIAEEHSFHLAYIMGHAVIDLDAQRALTVARQEAYTRVRSLFAALSKEDRAAARERVATINAEEIEAAISRLANRARQSQEAGL